MKACCVCKWHHHIAPSRFQVTHLSFVEYQQCSGWAAVSVTAEVAQSAQSDTGANGTLLSSTGSIKISPQTAGDPHHSAAFLTYSAAPARARSADNTNQLRCFISLHPPPTPPSLVCIIIHLKWWGFFISKFTRAHRPTAAADANWATVGKEKQSALCSVCFWLCLIISEFASYSSDSQESFLFLLQCWHPLKRK